MVSRSIQIIALALLISGCAATQKEIVTVTEYVEVPVVKYKTPEVPGFFGKQFKPSNIVFVESDGLICLTHENAQKLRYDIEILSGRIKSQNAWFNSLEESLSKD